MNENKVKTINGLICKNDLSNILSSMQTQGIIVFCTTDYRCGYSGCSEKQFYAPFYLEFRNGDAWIIYSTNSIRNDRMCIQQWNSEHIKQINSSIMKAYVVVPNQSATIGREKREVERYNEKIIQGTIFSTIDRVLFQDELENLIRAYANENK